MKYLYSLLSMRLAFVLLILPGITSNAQTLTARPNVSMTSASNGFYEYLPIGYNPAGSQTYPILIAFGGISQNGNGTPAELDYVFSNWGGPGWQIKNGKFPSSITVNGTLFRFIVILPQFSTAATPQNIDSIISYVNSHYRADTSRIYLTGNSLGGGYCWDYPGESIQYGKRIAAVVPTCAAAYYFSYKANNIAAASLPVWATHNANDVTVDPALTTSFVNGINAAPTPPVPLAKKTFFQDGSHNCADSTFNMNYGIGAYAWMLQYTRVAIPPVNKPPVAKAGGDVTVTLPKDSVLLNGNGSSDPEGGVINYSWSKIAGPTQFTFSSSTVVNPVFKNLVAGTYTLRLTVTDNKGTKATDDINIIVNQPPIAKAGLDVTITLPKDSVLLNGNGSSDPEGGTIIYGWTKIAGPTQFTLSSSSIVNPVVRNLLAGTYTFRLTVTDNKGAKATDDINIIVNQPPVSKAGSDVNITLPKDSVQLNGSGSFDPEGGTLTYSWAKTAGSTQYTLSSTTIVNPVLRNLVAGSYTFRLSVTDNKGAKTTDYINIIVNQPPVAKAGADVTITLPTNSVQLNGNGSSDPEGGVITYSWTKIAGPTQYTLTSTTLVNPLISNLVAGTYTLRLTVTDVKKAKATDDINIIVNPVAGQASIANSGFDDVGTLPLSRVTLVEVFPNPITDKVVLQVTDSRTGVMKVQIINANGTVKKDLILTHASSVSKVNIPLKELPAGVYVIKVQIGNSIASKKVIKL